MLLHCRAMFVFLVLMAASALAEDAKPTYAERYGWPKGAKVLMIHADDAGMSRASNEGIIATVEAGTVTSVSMMMPCAWVPAFVAYMKEHPKLCVGVHLTFTSEWDPYRWAPVAGRSVVPGLVDADGYMHDSVDQVLQNATVEEIETEIRAQIDLAERMGIEITHLDCHMGTLYADEKFFMAYLKVAIEKKIPILIAGGHLSRARIEEGEAVEELKKVVPLVWAGGLPVLDDLSTISYSWKTTDKKAQLIDFIRDLKPGVTWMNVHPTLPSDEGKAITDNRELLWGDYYALIDPEVMAAIKKEGIHLTSWRELMERRKSIED